jgi:MerR family copper efflux transcriptional regulator
MPRSGFTIGQVAQQTGLSPKAIRIYERKGLLPRTHRTSSGYRIFQAADVDVLRFIRQAKSIGLRLDEIKDVLELQRSGQKPCETVMALLGDHIAEIDRTLEDLMALRATLANACAQARASQDRGEGGVICDIIEGQGCARPEGADDPFSPHSYSRFPPSSVSSADVPVACAGVRDPAAEGSRTAASD